jgi:aminomethyltransferase
MVDFAGWDMPLAYRSIQEEHLHTRTSGSIFDVSHMGRVHFKGIDALKLLDATCTRDLRRCEIGQSRYSLVCNESGGVLDDVIVGRDEKHWIMVCNASNRDKLLGHFQAVRKSRDLDLDITDQTEATAMIALQGPKVIEKLADWLPTDVRSLKRFRFASDSFLLMNYTVFRSGYTGEDGVELVFSARVADLVLSKLAGRFEREGATIKPAGLGARDTLRLEAGLPLYGHELTEAIDPISAGLGWAVDLGRDFIGSRSLTEIAPTRKLVGLRLEGKRIARQQMPVVSGDRVVGEITSGTLSPTLGISIAMAYVEASEATEGSTRLRVDLKGTIVETTVVKLPFYRRAEA